MASDIMGRVYILELQPPFKHARYYIGWCSSNGLFRRLQQHRTGKGAVFTMRAVEAGCRLVLVYDAPGTRNDERRFKRWGNGARVVRSLEKKGQLNAQRITHAYKHGKDKLPAPLTIDQIFSEEE